MFETIENSPGDITFMIKMSVIEVYKEQIRDLVELKSEEKITLREDLNGHTFMEGVEEAYVSSELDVSEVMMNALANRRVGRTNMNEVSSRSHVVTIFNLEQNIKSESKVLKGKLFLVDLAGSECLTKTGATGERMEEAKFINMGLLTVGRVINALTEGEKYIPYRDSKLTRILKESLGGNSKTTLIVTASPSIYNETETTSTLRFGVRAKLIKNKVTVNLELSKEQLLKMLDLKDQRIEFLEAYLRFIENYIVAVLKQELPKFEYGKPWKYDVFISGKSQLSQDLNVVMANRDQNPAFSKTDLKEADKQSDPSDFLKEKTEYNERILALEDKIRAFSETETTLKAKIEELTNKNSSFQTRVKILEEKNNISESKIVILVENLKGIEEEFNILDERNIELENQNNELMNIVDELEGKNNQTALNNTFNILPFLDNVNTETFQNNNGTTASSLVGTNEIKNVNSNELNSLIELVKKTSVENDSIRKKNGELQNIVRDLSNSYKTLIEKEIPELEQEHKTVINNFRKIETKSDFVFNEKIISIVNEYLFKNDQLETEVKNKSTMVQNLNEEIKKLKKEYQEKISASQKKMKVLVKCVDSLAKFTEEAMISNMSQDKNRLEVNINQNDMFSSVLSNNNIGKGFDGNNSKFMKVVKGGNSKKPK